MLDTAMLYTRLYNAILNLNSHSSKGEYYFSDIFQTPAFVKCWISVTWWVWTGISKLFYLASSRRAGGKAFSYICRFSFLTKFSTALFNLFLLNCRNSICVLDTSLLHYTYLLPVIYLCCLLSYIKFGFYFNSSKILFFIFRLLR